ncbi:hypothetical protein [Marinicella rhabdoformis]|uniref:hypothetical protein n=1 Tax=Marinicella rhabdoformis TaxID=2580566 RepID=UPI0012AED41F|nr:hypothetical protein [Marinicella rhabdoformis]
MQAKTKNRLSIVAIVLLFATPVVVAYLMSSGAISYQPDSTKNHGEFITPPVKVADFSQDEWTNEFNNHWTLVYRVKGECDASCVKLEDNLHRYRLTMGHRADKLKLMLWAEDFKAMPTEDAYQHVLKITTKDLTGLNQTMDELSQVSHGDGNGLYVVAPEGYLMMAFKKENTSTEISQDIKLLLKRKGG